MMITITSIKLRSPLSFFSLSHQALHITRQLKQTNVLAFKKRGFWTEHYTLTAWPDEKSLKEFASSGAHLEAMKKSAAIAKEIRTLTLPMDSIPSWADAKQLLIQKGKLLSF